jgi:hypothetical protein
MNIYRHVIRSSSGEEKGCGAIIYREKDLIEECKEWEIDPNVVEEAFLDEELKYPDLPLDQEYEFWYTEEGHKQFLSCYEHILMGASSRGSNSKYVVKCRTLKPSDPVVYQDKYQLAIQL